MHCSSEFRFDITEELRFLQSLDVTLDITLTDVQIFDKAAMVIILFLLEACINTT